MQTNQMQLLPDGASITLMQPGDLAEVYELECASQQEPWSLQHFADELDNPVAYYESLSTGTVPGVKGTVPCL